jgi:Zn-finger nucleic acid-binding protein
VTTITSDPVAQGAPMAIHCPKCAAEMRHYERSGILVDQCPECRGVFLDRGELERLLDAEARAGLPAGDPRGWGQPGLQTGARTPNRGYVSEWHPDEDRHRWDDRSGREPGGTAGRPTRRRSLLGDLLEGFGD